MIQATAAQTINFVTWIPEKTNSLFTSTQVLDARNFSNFYSGFK